MTGLYKFVIGVVGVFCFSANLFAQSTQDGYVKEYNGRNEKKPMVGAEIMVRNATREVSGTDGEFQLKFRTLKPGAHVDVMEIRKSGYEIFNQEQLDVWRISDDGKPFTIVLCETSKFLELKDKYYALASDSYRIQREKEEAALNDLLKRGQLKEEEYEKQLLYTKQYYEDKLENVYDYIDRFARIDLEQISREERRIVDLVSKGMFEEAIKAYDAMKLDEKLIKNYTQYSKADSAVVALKKKSDEMKLQEDELLATLNNKYSLMIMHGGREMIDKVTKEYEHIAEQCMGSYRVLCSFVNFVDGIQDFERVAKWGRVALEVLPDNPLFKYTYCLKISSAEDVLGHREQYQLYRQRSREWLDMEMKNYPADAMIAYIADNLSSAMEEITIGNNLAKSLSISYALLEKIDSMYNAVPTDDMHYWNLYAKYNTYNTLSDAYLSLSNIDEARHNMDVCAQYADSLSSCEETTRCKRMLADVLTKKGYINMIAQDFTQAENDLLKARAIYSEIYDGNPYDFYGSMTANFSYIGLLYFYKGDYEESFRRYREALDFMEEIISNRPYPLFLGAYSELINNLGYLNFLTGDVQEAEKYYKKAIEVATPFAEDNPLRHLSALCTPQINLGTLYLSQKKLDEFSSLQDDYWDAAEKCLEWLGITYQESFIIASDNKGYYELLVGHTDSALDIWKQMCEIMPEYIQFHPDSFLYNGLKEQGLVE